MIAEIKEIIKAVTAIASGKLVHWETNDRRVEDCSRGLTPAQVDRIMTAANAGDTLELFKLAAELPEKNWDIFHALQTRRNAVLGCSWHLEPGDDSAAAKTAAKKLEKELRESGSDQDLDSWYDLMGDLERALLPGITVSEIIWQPGGSLAGFNFIEPHHLTLRDGRQPKLITVNFPLGMELPRGKFVVHMLRAHGPDPVRGGLIRPLAWLHCFANLNLKDLLRFIERYGMPFTVAKVDQTAWDTELGKIKALIRSFGPDGGGVFTKSTEVELLQAANNTGDIYFKLLEYTGAAITKIVLGQTAASGDAAGFSKGGAQSDVRQDIKDADCRWIENTFNVQISKPWAVFNCGDTVAAPRLEIDSEPAEDIKDKYEALKMKFDAMGVAIRAGVLTATADIEVVVRETMELPELDTLAKDEWARNMGVKRPITLAQIGQPGPAAPTVDPAALTALELPAEGGTSPSVARTQTALAAWLGPFADAINELSDDESGDKQFAAKLAAMSSADSLGKFDSEAAAAVLTVQAAESMKAAVEKTTRQTKETVK